MKKLVFIFFLLEFSVGYSQTEKPAPHKEYPPQASDSPQKEIVSDTAQLVSEEKFVEEREFKNEALNHFSNKDEIPFQDIDDSFVRGLGDVLQMRSLINVIEVGPPGQLEAGLWGGSPNLRVFIDGSLYEQQSLHLPQRGLLDLNTIPIENIERVEILPAGMANLWEKGAGLGGINIVTKDYWGTAPYSRVTVDRGPDKYRRTRVELGRGITSRGRIYLTAGFKRSNGYLTNSDYDGTILSGKTTFSMRNNLNLRLSSYQYKTKMGLPLFANADIKDSRKRESNWGITTDLLFRQNENSLFSLDLRYDKREQKLKSSHAGLDIRKIKGLYGLKATQTLKRGKRHNFKIEAYADRRKLETPDTDDIACRTYLSLADLINVNQKANLLLFSKVEREDGFKSNFSGLGGMSYQIAPNINLFSTLGRLVNYPSSMDLHWNLLSVNGDDTSAIYMEEGNPDLKSQESIVFDLGAAWRKDNSHLSCLLFKNRIDDFAVWTNVDTSIRYGYWKPINTKADIRGISLNSFLHFPDHFKTSISYCFKESKDSNLKLLLPHSPQHSLFGYLQYENEFLKREIGLKLRVETNILSERFLDEYEKDKEPPVAIFNGKITIRFLDFHFYYVVENFTDRVYRLTQDYPTFEKSWWWGFYWEFFD